MIKQTTKSIRKEDIKRKWFVFNANEKVLGRLSTQIVNFLVGKNKVFYTPNQDCGDYVVVTNVDKIILTGKKWSDKIYYSHSNYPGGLKQKSASALFEKKPSLLLTKAVKGMLPRNRLAKQQMLRLFVYVGDKHPHEGQSPELIKF